MSNADIRGRFVWHELMTSDTEAATAFYTKLVPWKTEPSGMPSYSLWMSGKNRAGGLMTLADGEAPGTPPHWIIYIGTPDVDATVEAAQKLGGKVLKPAADIPNVGRFAVLSDPQGAAFAVFKPGPGSGDGASGGAIGDFTWHELATTDPEAAMRFYSDLFGWSKGAAHDMGPDGVYQLVSHGGQDVGGVYRARDTSVPPSWLSYCRVADASKAAAAVKAGGGRILNGPMEVPGGSWIVMLLDPQGGAFAVVEAPRAAATKAAQPASPPKAQPQAAKARPTPKTAAAKPAAPPAAAAPAAQKPAAKSAGMKPAPKPAAKPAAKKKAVAKKTAAKGGKKAARSASAKKRPTARKAAAKKSTSAKRGGKSVKRAAKGKARKKR